MGGQVSWDRSLVPAETSVVDEKVWGGRKKVFQVG